MRKKDNKKLKKFKSGMILTDNDLNSLYNTLSYISKKANMEIKESAPWESGSVLTAHSLNKFLEDIENVATVLGFDKIEWTFGKFKDGTVLKASQLNEIIDVFDAFTTKIKA